jgi:DnaJ-class molecular chaperone
MSNILLDEYVICDTCHGQHHRDDMRGKDCKHCDAEVGGEG